MGLQFLPHFCTHPTPTHRHNKPWQKSSMLPALSGASWCACVSYSCPLILPIQQAQVRQAWVSSTRHGRPPHFHALTTPTPYTGPHARLNPSALPSLEPHPPPPLPPSLPQSRLTQPTTPINTPTTHRKPNYFFNLWISFHRC